MTHLTRYKWFYATLGFWFFAAALSAWALIFSPLQSRAKKMSEFSAEINGIAEGHQILESSAPVNASFKELYTQWKNQGWICAGGSRNLASLFLNTPEDWSQAISSLAQVRVFKRENDLRFLGLLADHGQTYQWIAETPLKAFEPPSPSDIRFPLKPPRGAVNVFTVNSSHLKTLMWSTGGRIDFMRSFEDNYVSQGFTGKFLSRDSQESRLLLQKGSMRLFAAVPTDAKKCVIFLVHQ